jgi:branched-chain amino acid transport system ATP-binding protein
LATLLNTAKARDAAQRTDQHVDEVMQWLDLKRVEHQVASNLPYGFQKVLGMGIGLAARPRLILLDEPAAGLSAEETDHVRDTIRLVRKRGISVVVIDHNMRFISDLCDRVLVMAQGRELAQGAPQEVLRHSAVIEAYLGKRYVKADH